MDQTKPISFPKKKIIFRADANSQIGLGHLIRSLALAEMLQPEFKAVFAVQNPAAAIQQQVTDKGFELITLPETADYAAEATYLSQNLIGNGDIIALDGYNFDMTYQEILRQQPVKLVCIDDIHSFPFVADVIINQAGAVAPANYRALPHTKFCLGPAYALLRKPFLTAAKQSRNIDHINRIFLNMGGADPQNQTLGIVKYLTENFSQIQVEVVTGSAYEHLPTLDAFISNNNQITRHQQLDAAQMCRLMAQCDAAILPPSSVAYEWCSVGGPLFIHQTAKNQNNIASFLLQEGLALPLEELSGFLQSNNLKPVITSCLEKQHIYFNGNSQQKLRKVFFDLFFKTDLKLKLVSAADMMILYDWANDTAVRENSFNPAAIPLPIHQIWFENKLKADNCFFLMAHLKNIPAGMIRYDLRENQAVINYLLDKNFRGKGLGTILLQKGEESIRQKHPEIKILIGHVQESNKASFQSFLKSGYLINKNIAPLKLGAVVFEKQLR